MRFRREVGSDLWHYREECREWPSSGKIEVAERPRCGLVCPECKGRGPAWRPERRAAA